MGLIPRLCRIATIPPWKTTTYLAVSVGVMKPDEWTVATHTYHAAHGISSLHMDVDSDDERMVEHSGQSSLLANMSLEFIYGYVYVVGSHALLQQTSTKANSE